MRKDEGGCKKRSFESGGGDVWIGENELFTRIFEVLNREMGEE
jgi:hypothetical protein